MRKVYIDQLFRILGKERTRVHSGGIIHAPQIYLKVSERAIPARYLDNEGQGQPEDMKDPHAKVLSSPDDPDKKKDYP